MEDFGPLITPDDHDEDPVELDLADARKRVAKAVAQEFGLEPDAQFVKDGGWLFRFVHESAHVVIDIYEG